MTWFQLIITLLTLLPNNASEDHQNLTTLQIKLASRCLANKPEIYDKKILLERVNKILRSLEDKTCFNLNLCKPPLPWMKKTSGDEALATKKKNFDDIQTETIKPIPRANENVPFDISAAVYIEDINTINELDQDIKISYFIQLSWKVQEKQCLGMYSALGARKVEGIEVPNGTRPLRFIEPKELRIILPPEHFALFWIPDVFLSNAKDNYKQSFMIEPRFLEFDTDEDHETHKWFCSFRLMARKCNSLMSICSLRYCAVVACPMNFRFYPVDTQTCLLNFRSFMHTSDEVNLNFGKVVTELANIKLGDRELFVKGNDSTIVLFEKSYSSITISIRLERNVIDKLVGVYVPSVLVLIISFTSLWLGLNSLSDRIAIGITALLTQMTQFAQVRTYLPDTTYINFMDFWMVACILFVALQLIQATFVYWLLNKKLRDAEREHEEQQRVEEDMKTLFAREVPPAVQRIYNESEVNLRRRRRVLYNATDELERLQELDAIKSKKSFFKENCGWLISLEKLLFEPTALRSSPQYLPMKVDAISRIVFPLSFASFAVTYWYLLYALKD